jgi:hypothetical protein
LELKRKKRWIVELHPTIPNISKQKMKKKSKKKNDTWKEAHPSESTKIPPKESRLQCLFDLLVEEWKKKIMEWSLCIVDLLLEKWKKKTLVSWSNEGAVALYAIEELPLALTLMNLNQHVDYVVDMDVPSNVAYVVKCSQGIPIVFDTQCPSLNVLSLQNKMILSVIYLTRFRLFQRKLTVNNGSFSYPNGKITITIFT